MLNVVERELRQNFCLELGIKNPLILYAYRIQRTSLSRVILFFSFRGLNNLTQKLFDIKIPEKRHSCHQNGNAENHFFVILFFFREAKNEFIQRITFMGRLLKMFGKMKKMRNGILFTIIIIVIMPDACISSFQPQH